MSAWSTDILGEGFEQTTLSLGHDHEGEVVATLVRCRPDAVAALAGALAGVDVLYVHGWSDYFFQIDLAHSFTRMGATFHALDLRKYGRSLRDGQTPGYVDDLAVYDADIAAALEVIGAEHRRPRPLVLLAHSTGGLVLTLWAARHPGQAAALVLNSPWLELQVGAAGRAALEPFVQARSRFDPLGAHPVADLGFYTRAQTAVGGYPPVGFRPEWRPERGFPTHPGWLAAVLAGQRTIAAGVDVGCPALVLLSSRSVPALSWAETMVAADSVLDVGEVARAATGIGRLVTLARIDGALHDVFLSSPAPRDEAYRVLHRWLPDALA